MGIDACLIGGLTMMANTRSAYGAQETRSCVLENKKDYSEMEWLNPDAICGPRCVRFLLEFYEAPNLPDLVELVASMQGSQDTGPISLGAINRKLQEYGIHTAMVRIDKSTDIQWEYPIVLHLEPPKMDVGHFVVWLPQAHGTATVRYWDGLRGVVIDDRQDFIKSMSGYTILTKSEPFDVDDEVRNRSSASVLKSIHFVGCVLAVLMAVFCLQRLTLRFRNMHGGQ